MAKSKKTHFYHKTAKTGQMEKTHFQQKNWPNRKNTFFIIKRQKLAKWKKTHFDHKTAKTGQFIYYTL